ncbi:MAG TPA: oligopeptide/dipeptide ABC transporter ATP-binding protein [Mycobacteriales bacterium]|nr:oligopeptide/dipeptide ABC transporter ATP-binding protein [Mycobacteriales bacterium]
MSVVQPVSSGGVSTSGAPMPRGAAPLLQGRDLSVQYQVRSRTKGTTKKRTVSAVDHVDLDIWTGETLGLVGESGCGKTTLGRALLGRVPLAGGTLAFDGADITNSSTRRWRELHRDMQLIFQDPYSSMNPRWQVREIIAEPLRVHHVAKGPELRKAVDELLEMVRLPRAAGDRYPHAFSGGQRQRIVIARALALRPKFVVADEPVSALDVSIQAQVVSLMQELQAELGLSYLFIAHNLAVVKHIAHRVAVMYLGHVVEIGTKESLYSDPRHPYTQALLSAVPIPDPTVQRPERVLLHGDPPSAISPPSGCRFHTRCPLAVERCKVERPPLVELTPGHQVACWVAQGATEPVAAAAPSDGGTT